MKILKIFRKNFSFNANKYKNISKVETTVKNVLVSENKEHKWGEIKTPPKYGYYSLPHIPGKGMALEMGLMDKVSKRDPVSAYYSVKVKDTLYHVFNAARIVILS